MMPKLTIVTANLNHGRFLADAIDSARQPGVALEHWVIDGGSTDESHDVLAKCPDIKAEICPGLDSHAALNRGLALAQGQFIGFLNADDRYDSGCLSSIVAAFDDDPALDAICGGMRFFRVVSGHEIEISRYRHLEGAAQRLEVTFGAPGFNSWFFRTSSLRAAGGFRDEWHFAADRDLLMRLLSRTRPKALPDLVYHYRVHEGSRTLAPGKANRTAFAREHIRLARLHAKTDWADVPGGAGLLADWRALEGLRLLAGLRHRALGRADMADLATTPWWRLPAALRHRRRWLATIAP